MAINGWSVMSKEWNFHKTSDNKAQGSVLVGEHSDVLGGWYTSTPREWKCLHSGPLQTLPYTFLPLGHFKFHLSHILYNKTLIVSIVLSWVPQVILVSSQTWSALWEPLNLWPSWTEVWVTWRPRICNWHLKFVELSPLACAHSGWLVSGLNWIMGHPVDVRKMENRWKDMRVLRHPESGSSEKLLPPLDLLGQAEIRVGPGENGMRRSHSGKGIRLASCVGLEPKILRELGDSPIYQWVPAKDPRSEQHI